MIALLGAVLVASLGGSLHCAAMCGPFAGLAGGTAPGARWTPHVSYALGRLGSYVLLGAIAGAIGAAVDVASIGGVAMVIAGVAMLLWGGASLARALGWRRGSSAGGATGPMLYAIRRKRPALRAALVGVLTAALPCGWLYAFVVVAAGTASPLLGGAVMATFWLGSQPALLGAGLTLRALARKLGPRLPVVTASLQIAVGVIALGMRAPMVLDPPAHAHHSTNPTEATSCH